MIQDGEFPNLPKLTLDGTDTPLEIDRVELRGFYLPLANYLIRRATNQKRFILGIVGPPGSGKTAFSTLLAVTINMIFGSEIAAFVGLDGWHYPNAYLETNTTSRDGHIIPLKKVKGAPETFDIAAVLQFLQRVRNGENIFYPVYSRRLHNPIPDASAITPNHQIILMEGNYLLLNCPSWSAFRQLFDTTIFLSVPRDQLISALRLRHLCGGKNPEMVERHLAETDLPNLDLILSQSTSADILVEKIDSKRIAQVIYPEFGRQR